MPYTVMMVAAAGGSTRMGRPKQHILLGQHPVLIHTLMALQQVDAIDELLLITRAEDTAHFAALAAQAGVTKLRTVVAGSNEIGEDLCLPRLSFYQHLALSALKEAHSVLSQLVGFLVLQQPTLISFLVQ